MDEHDYWRTRPRLSPAADAESASWIPPRIHGFAQSVLSLVPDGFPTYLRLFHPARRSADQRPVPWREVAAANGTRAHPGMQFTAVTRAARGTVQLGLFEEPPAIGELPEVLTGPLITMLAAHTATADRCRFGRWDGYAGMVDQDAGAPELLLPSRCYRLLAGPLTDLTRDPGPSVGWQPPNLWWPEDRTWFVATEVDLDSTYLGVTHACARALLDHTELEIMEIDPHTGVDIDSDKVNRSHS